MAVPEQQGPVPRQLPERADPPLHGAAASGRRDAGLRRLPGRPVGAGQPGPGLHQDAVPRLPRRHALGAAGPCTARYGRTRGPRAPGSACGRCCAASCEARGVGRLVSHCAAHPGESPATPPDGSCWYSCCARLNMARCSVPLPPGRASARAKVSNPLTCPLCSQNEAQAEGAFRLSSQHSRGRPGSVARSYIIHSCSKEERSGTSPQHQLTLQANP